MIDQATIRALAEKWLKGTISEEEKKIFENWYNNQPPGSIDWLSAESEQELKSRIFQSILSKLEEEAADEQLARVIALPNQRRWSRKLAAAAVILLLAGAGTTYLFLRNRSGEPSNLPLAINKTQEINVPGTAKATLTLANGAIIQLDSASNGSLAQQGSANVLKLSDGQIAYQPAGTIKGYGTEKELIYNTLTVPRGGQVVSLALSDGTKVWLNVESSLRYPVVFNGKDRKVSITGEAYFEVSKDPSRKFLVEAESATTEVLGTHFNVNTYEREQDVFVTLLEGSVKVTNPGKALLVLKPGQQADVNSTGKIRLNNTPDLEAVLAWKNGMFKLNNADMKTIMGQLSRWYDIDVRFEKEVENKRFTGIISRNTELSKVLEMLSLTKEVSFKREGRIVTVSP
jgi:transmembrane sensor